ncbi:MAG: Gfo/Idh/MocA family protein [Chloroflexota bacterium]
MTSLRLGLIGAGQHGRYLSPLLREAGDVTLVAAADADAEARARAQADCGYGTVYADYHEMLSAERLDAVLVALPHQMLAEACLAALRQGCHVFCEKPLALNQRQGAEVVAVARSAQKVLMVGYCLRFNQARLALKQLIDDGVLGTITAVSAGKGSRPWPGWLSLPAEQGGGQMLFLGSHLIDQVLWLTGQSAELVYAEQTQRRDTGADETTAFTLRLSGGIRGELLVTQGVGVSFDYVELFGTAGRARAEWPAMLLTVHSSAVPAYANPSTIRILGDSHRPMYIAELAEFVSAIRDGRPPASDGASALRTLAVLDAVFASSARGTPVPTAAVD